MIGVGLAELPRPLADRFVGDDDAALSEQFRDIALAEAKPEVEPDGVADDLLWEAVSFVRCGSSDG